jgi:hypothetical protein
MWTRLQLGFSIALVSFCFAVQPPRAAQQSASPSQVAPNQTPLTPEQIHDLMVRTIANQHRDDTMLDSFERTERQTVQATSESLASGDRVFRVVPTGSGTLRLLLSANGTPVSAALYQHQLHDWENVLQVAVHPNDPREVAVLAKQRKRQKDRAGLVDSVLNAYQVTWLARETRDGRVLEKLQLDPNLSYHSRDTTAQLLTHARATVWIDAEAAQVASIDATIIRDVSFGGGVLGKIYHGGHFHMEQSPAAPDIWEPSLYQYDISGRKFLFSFTMHEKTTTSHYVLFDGPGPALVQAQNDLAHCCNFASDP